jgi:hypothetical protein
MGRRGKKATRADALTPHDWRSIRRILRKVGLTKYIQAGKEEQGRIDLEDFYDYALSQLEEMEKTIWKYQRSPEVQRIYKQRALELGEKSRLLTREDMARLLVRTHWQEEWGQRNQTPIVRRLVQKLRERMSKADH